MSGLDTSQDVTVEVSKHADDHHEHSRKKPGPEAAEEPRDEGGEPAAAAEA